MSFNFSNQPEFYNDDIYNFDTNTYNNSYLEFETNDSQQFEQFEIDESQQFEQSKEFELGEKNSSMDLHENPKFQKKKRIREVIKAEEQVKFYPNDLREEMIEIEENPEEATIPQLEKGTRLSLNVNNRPYYFEDLVSDIYKIRFTQYDTIKNQRNNLPILKEQIQNLINRVNNFNQNLEQLFNSYFIHNSDISKLLRTQNEIKICSTQLELYLNEINHEINPSGYWKSSALVLLENPFPTSLLKQKEICKRIVVRLITTTSLSMVDISPIEASLIPIQNPSQNELVQIKNVQKPATCFYNYRDVSKSKPNNNLEIGYKATFENICFSSGTRMRLFGMQFKCKLSFISAKSENVISDLSPPFIVYTNGNQWNDIEGQLLKWEAFRNQKQVGWCKLVNLIQRRYIMATSKDPENPKRILSLQDFNFLFKSKINNQRTLFNLNSTSLTNLISCKTRFSFK